MVRKRMTRIADSRGYQRMSTNSILFVTRTVRATAVGFLTTPTVFTPLAPSSSHCVSLISFPASSVEVVRIWEIILRSSVGKIAAG